MTHVNPAAVIMGVKRPHLPTHALGSLNRAGSEACRERVWAVSVSLDLT